MNTKLRLWLLLLTGASWLICAALRGGYGNSTAEAPRPSEPRRELLDPQHLEVLDGDTLRLGSRQLRLLGIDTPECAAPWFRGDQEPWASRARAFTQARVRAARRVEACSRGELDRYGRELTWILLDGVPLAALLAGAGLGYPTAERYGEGGFPALSAEVAAQAKAPAFEAPWRWRARQRRR